MMPPLPPKFAPEGGGAKKQRGRSRDFTPLPWTDFFDKKQELNIGSDKFNVYLKGSSGPVFYLLHGGGYSGLTWACMSEELTTRIECRIVAPDLRGHGDTKTDGDNDLSTDRQVQDIASIYTHLFPQDPPPTFVVGHSMGGALAVHVTNRQLIPHLIAVGVIDVVEGSAMDALHGMTNFLRGRPSHFESVEAAIEWCVKTGTVRNVRAARVSMPAQVQPSTAPPGSVLNDMVEEREGEEEEASSTPAAASTVCEWRIDLLQSEQYWTGWFKGLSQLFLGVPAPKLLILAGVDRLDKDLTVGQMQGKFQMIVLPKVGHAVHEDSPDRLADAITTFCVRNKFCEAIGDYHPVYPGC
uniref:Protein phosphatase methylesterase 1 n=1 Tax=Plectus sambesii TaxID=2011161 RepID=A0A914W4J7_9BILA